MGFGFLSAGHGAKGFCQIKAKIMGLSTPGAVNLMAKCHISVGKWDFGSNNGTFHNGHLVHCISI